MSAHMVIDQATKLCSILCQLARIKFFRILGGYHPPTNYTLALDNGFSNQLNQPASPQDALGFDGFLYAVPKKRRSVERRRAMSFGYTNRMEQAQPKTNIVSCPKCGNWHEIHTLCGHCYDQVRRKTAEMRTTLEKDEDYRYNQTKSDLFELVKKYNLWDSDMKSERQRYMEELGLPDENRGKR